MTPPDPPARFALRPVVPEDSALLEELYRASRADEVSAWGWSEAQAEGFLRMQAQIEQRARAAQHPGAEHRIVVVDGRAVGRLLVDRPGDRLELVDIALTAEARGHGLGTALLRDLLLEAQTRGVPVVLRVRRGNRAESLYRKLGFAVTGEDAMNLTMTFEPPPGLAPAATAAGSPGCRIRT